MRNLIALRKAMIVAATLFIARLADGANIELVMPQTTISPTGDRAVFATPLDYQSDHLVLAQVEPADANTPNAYLRTVIRLGARNISGGWTWHTRTIENRTLHDPYHTQPSVAFDRDGHIHVAYNMHHVPWQYAVSSKPYDIDSIEFRGEAVTMAELDTIRLHNKTYFPSPGKAAIPGNQITYPAFVKDRKGDLFTVYRYALRPARDWDYRNYAIGLARYDSEKKTWHSIGGKVKLNPGDVKTNGAAPNTSSPLIFDTRYLPYTVTIAFDAANGMHAIWTWWDRNGGTDGSRTHMPSYRHIANTSAETSSVNWAEAERIPGWRDDVVFNTAKALTVAANGDVLAILEPTGKPRQLIRRFHDTGKWGIPVDMPNSAPKIKVSNDGTEWAFASGLNLFRRSPGGAWSSPIPVGKDLCDPWPIYVAQENTFFIRAKNCSDFSKSVIYKYRPD